MATIPKPIISIGDKVTMEGFDDPESLFYGIVATVKGLEEHQNASDDDWHWSANIEYLFDGELGWSLYPVKFLKIHQPKQPSLL